MVLCTKEDGAGSIRGASGNTREAPPPLQAEGSGRRREGVVYVCVWGGGQGVGSAREQTFSH